MGKWMKTRPARVLLSTHTVTDKCVNCGHKHAQPVAGCGCDSDWCPCNPQAECVS